MRPNLRVQWVYDHDGQNSQESPVGGNLPESETEYLKNPVTPGGGPAISYAEYCEYYGNPDRHLVLACLLQRQCPCCETWKDVGSLWGIDFMDDSPEIQKLYVTSLDHDHDQHYYSEAEAIALPGYPGEVARELIAEYKQTTKRKATKRGR